MYFGIFINLPRKGLKRMTFLWEINVKILLQQRSIEIFMVYDSEAKGKS